MTRTIDKIKYDGTHIRIDWHTGDDAQEARSFQSADAPDPQFLAALTALRLDVAAICEIELDATRLAVRGVTLTVKTGKPHVTITAIYPVDVGALVLHTPHAEVSAVTWTRICHVVGHALAYVDGVRAPRRNSRNQLGGA